MNTNDFPQVFSQAQAAYPNWHGWTWLHALIALGGIYATHTNWEKLCAAFNAIQSYCDTRTGGIVVILFQCLFGSPKLKEAPLKATLANAQAALDKPAAPTP